MAPPNGGRLRSEQESNDGERRRGSAGGAGTAHGDGSVADLHLLDAEATKYPYSVGGTRRQLLQLHRSTGPAVRRQGLLRRANQRVRIIGRLRFTLEKPLQSGEKVPNSSVRVPVFHLAVLVVSIISC
jgi:hypothetical protein